MAADHDYLEGGWKDKYVIFKRCPACGGGGQPTRCGCRSVGECMHGLMASCEVCKGTGLIPVDPEAVYFVLRLDADPIARMAARTYAWWANQVNQKLAEDLRAKIDQCEEGTPA